jgi:integrase
VFSNDGHRYVRINTSSSERARDKAGLAVRVHDLRHTFGHRLRAAGVGIEDRSDLLGHVAGRMTAHYSARDLQRLLDAAEKVVIERPATVLRAVGGA